VEAGRAQYPTEQYPTEMSCAFCERLREGTVLESAPHACAIADGYPVSGGHTLVISRRHEADLFALTAAEQLDMWSLVALVRENLWQELRPDGFTIGVNVGAAAGQTIPHAHIHAIPRFAGDVPDPRGGVRWVLSGKARYW
jgi:diadenosine tetraphosphate (Ap4A) HIT family hydrolase